MEVFMKTAVGLILVMILAQAAEELDENKSTVIKKHDDTKEQHKHEEIEKPNVVFILVDDVGWADFDYNTPGKSPIPTPNIDTLAGQG